jgi:hypothetical protein
VFSSSTSGHHRKLPKVTKADFTPNVNRLANAGKASTRERIATNTAFPKDKDTFVWECIQSATKDKKDLQSILEATQKDADVKENLIEFVEYSITLHDLKRG